MKNRSRSILARIAGPALFGGAAAATAVLVVRARRRIDFDDKVVVISGASRGLGLELARGFGAEGANLVLLARDERNLAQSADELRRRGVRVTTVVCDVSEDRKVRDAVASIIADAGRVDVLVNNAGTIQVGPVENMGIDDYESALRVHFWGPFYLMREITPHMKARRQGRIVNIASIGGKVAVPHLLPYAASKFALVGLSEGMRAELLKDGIYVTTVCPGLMRTGSHFNAYFKGQHKKEYALFAIANASPLFSTDAEAAARRIIEACRYGTAEIVITPQARLLRLANSLFPNLMAEILALVNQALPKTRGPSGDTLRRGIESRSPIARSALTRLADRAAERNNELAPAKGTAVENNRRSTDDPAPLGTLCACTHPTHFLGRCRSEISRPEQICAACMENHFHRIDDPAI
jgi:short-subunit dehydrogenase